MRISTLVFALACWLDSPAFVRAGETDLPPIPAISREYRGVWVATVANIDWPSKPGLPSDQQQAEAIKILDTAADLKMNVIVLQVRTSCDSLYESRLEPWSYFLSGKQGQAPSPAYDPLSFWIEQAHLRGLELHAWFNPFRAKNTGQSYSDCESHISQSQPQLVKKYGNDKTNYLWLDPGEAAAREHSLSVFLDVLQRYDVDGIHIDDYFYPYPVDDIPFPDDPAWQRYVESGGKSTRDDWRRESMNQFIKQLYQEIKHIKPHVKFGISPFGIWKPGYPSSVAGFSQHDKLYADARLWLNEGWCDYYSPQLYWAISAKQQSFPALLRWWSEENKLGRHLVPGIYTSRIGNKTNGYSVEEVVNQTYLSRHMSGSHGVVHFSMKSLLENRENICDKLKAGAYSEMAITPAAPWLDSEPPKTPKLSIERTDSNQVIAWAPNDDQQIARWCLWTLVNGKWQGRVLPAGDTRLEVPTSEMKIEAAAICAIDAFGNESQPAIAR